MADGRHRRLVDGHLAGPVVGRRRRRVLGLQLEAHGVLLVLAGALLHARHRLRGHAREGDVVARPLLPDDVAVPPRVEVRGARDVRGHEVREEGLEARDVLRGDERHEEAVGRQALGQQVPLHDAERPRGPEGPGDGAVAGQVLEVLAPAPFPVLVAEVARVHARGPHLLAEGRVERPHAVGAGLEAHDGLDLRRRHGGDGRRPAARGAVGVVDHGGHSNGTARTGILSALHLKH